MQTKLIMTVALGLAASSAAAQDNIPWYTIDGGGGFCSGGEYTLEDGTIGQPDAGEMTGGGYTLLGGYWNTTGNEPCDSIDFNNDGLFPDTADIDALLSVFSGGPCL